MIDGFPTLAEIMAYGLPLLLAITLHEAAHGLAAWGLGDRTALENGRVSLNPIRHIDFVGTLMVPAMLLLFRAPVPIGWARPVPIDPARLRHPRRDMLLISGAGPAANIVLAIISGLVLLWADPQPGQVTLAEKAVSFSLFANLVIAGFNLIPLMPLDGGRMLASLLPESLARAFGRWSPWVAALLLTGLLIVPFLLPLLGSDIDVAGDILRPAALAGMGFVESVTGMKLAWMWT